jgi:autotransporter-associated beta strand protein
MDPIPWGVVTQGPTSNIPPSTPFSGTPAPVPGKIEAEDYNIGGEGISYHDLDNYNRGCSYRTDGVDVVGSYPNFIVYYFGTDEWLDYSINASFTDSYKVNFYLACPFDNRTFNLYLDGNMLASNLSIPNTGGWDNYQVVTHENIQIPQGKHVLRVKLNQEGVNWDYMQFESTSVSVFNITATAGAGGAITPSGPVAVSAGSNQSFTIAASLGYQISNVTVDGVSTGAVSAFTFTHVTAHHTIAASFASTVVKLSGAIIGTPGSWGNSGNTISNVFDGNTGTYFDAPDPGTDTWAGLDLGAATSAVVTAISFFPRAGLEWRMSGCLFQGANDPEFNAPVDLYTIPDTPPAGWSEVAITNPGSFRYLRYLSVGANYGNVAEVKFYGVVSTVPPGITRLSPTHGSMYGGTPVTITGTNLAGTSSVTFGDINAASMTVLNDTTVTCVTPAGAPGTVDVVLTAPGGSATNVNGFTYNATVYLTPPGDSSAGSTSFNEAGRWSDGQVPSAANDYVVTNNATLRTPTPLQDYTFLGNKLTLQGGGILMLYGQSNTTVTVTDLTVDNGTIRQTLKDAVQYLAGAITVGSGGLTLRAVQDNSELRVQAPISGSGAVTLTNTTVFTAKVVLSATNTFTGPTIVIGKTLEVQGQIAPNPTSGHAIIVGFKNAGNPAVIRIVDGAKILLPSTTLSGHFVVGDTGYLYGRVIQDGGQVVGAAPIRLAINDSTSEARYSLNGGTVSLTNSESFLQIGQDGTGTVSQAGGTVTVARNQFGGGNSALLLGHSASGVGIYTLTGGGLFCTNSTATSSGTTAATIGYSGTGSLTVNGAAATASFRGDLALAWNNSSSGTLYFARGELRVNRLYQGGDTSGGTALFKFGGSSGTAVLRPYDADAAIGHATGANNIGITLTGSNAVLRSTDAFGTARTLTIYSALGESGGPFGITLDGTGTSVFQSACTYGGPTVVQSGTLRLAGPNVLPPATGLTVVSGATLDLVSGVNTVKTFRVNGELQVRNKLYGAERFASGVTGAGAIFAVEGASEKGMVLKIL